MSMIAFRNLRQVYWILLGVIILIMSTTILILLYHHSNQAIYFKTWIETHHTGFFIWRMALMLLIFLLWPLYVRYKTAGIEVSSSQHKALIQRRYYIIALLAGLEALFSLGGWL